MKQNKDKVQDNKIRQLISHNSNLRNEIEKIVTEIDIHLADCQNPESLSIQNILDDLPIEQQIALYQDSIIELKQKLTYTKLEPIEKKEYEIKSKTETLYNLKKQRKILRKLSLSHNKVINDLNQNMMKGKIEEIQNQKKAQKLEYKNLKNLLKKNENYIKEQNNAIFILEDNCLFIKENIDYKKGTLVNERTQKCAQLFELEQNAQRIENVAKSQEETFKAEIARQKESISYLTQEIESITMELNYILQQRRISEIKMKQRKKKNKNEKYISSDQSQSVKISQGISTDNDNDINDLIGEDSINVATTKENNSSDQSQSLPKHDNKYSQIQDTMQQLLDDIDKNSSLKANLV